LFYHDESKRNFISSHLTSENALLPLDHHQAREDDQSRNQSLGAFGTSPLLSLSRILGHDSLFKRRQLAEPDSRIISRYECPIS